MSGKRVDCKALDHLQGTPEEIWLQLRHNPVYEALAHPASITQYIPADQLCESLEKFVPPQAFRQIAIFSSAEELLKENHPPLVTPFGNILIDPSVVGEGWVYDSYSEALIQTLSGLSVSEGRIGQEAKTIQVSGRGETCDMYFESADGGRLSFKDSGEIVGNGENTFVLKNGPQEGTTITLTSQHDYFVRQDEYGRMHVHATGPLTLLNITHKGSPLQIEGGDFVLTDKTHILFGPSTTWGWGPWHAEDGREWSKITSHEWMTLSWGKYVPDKIDPNAYASSDNAFEMFPVKENDGQYRYRITLRGGNKVKIEQHNPSAKVAMIDAPIPNHIEIVTVYDTAAKGIEAGSKFIAPRVYESQDYPKTSRFDLEGVRQKDGRTYTLKGMDILLVHYEESGDRIRESVFKMDPFVRSTDYSNGNLAYITLHPDGYVFRLPTANDMWTMNTISLSYFESGESDFGTVIPPQNDSEEKGDRDPLRTENLFYALSFFNTRPIKEQKELLALMDNPRFFAKFLGRLDTYSFEIDDEPVPVDYVQWAFRRYAELGGKFSYSSFDASPTSILEYIYNDDTDRVLEAMPEYGASEKDQIEYALSNDRDGKAFALAGKDPQLQAEIYQRQGKFDKVIEILTQGEDPDFKRAADYAFSSIGCRGDDGECDRRLSKAVSTAEKVSPAYAAEKLVEYMKEGRARESLTQHLPLVFEAAKNEDLKRTTRMEYLLTMISVSSTPIEWKYSDEGKRFFRGMCQYALAHFTWEDAGMSSLSYNCEYFLK